MTKNPNPGCGYNLRGRARAQHAQTKEPNSHFSELLSMQNWEEGWRDQEIKS